MSHNTKSNEDLASEVWVIIHSGLVKDGVKFPNNFDGIGAAYGGYVRLIEALTLKYEEKEEAVREAYSKGREYAMAEAVEIIKRTLS